MIEKRCFRDNQSHRYVLIIPFILTQTHKFLIFYDFWACIIFRNTEARKDYYSLLQAQHEDKTSPDISVLSRGSKIYSKLKIQNPKFNLHSVMPSCSGRAILGRSVRISPPREPTATVCSKWADHEPSAVTAVQSSSKTLTL